MTELKPCPFCGKLPTRNCEANIFTNEPMYWISCVNDKCFIQPCTPMYKTKGADARAWNKRVER